MSAWQNSTKGRAVRCIRHFPPALGRSFNRRFGHVVLSVAQSLTVFLHPKGQVMYYCQAVDLVHQKEYFADKSVLRECLALTNMASKTCNLMSFCPLHIGLKVKITKKLMAPELVQECPAEVPLASEKTTFFLEKTEASQRVCQTNFKASGKTLKNRKFRRQKFDLLAFFPEDKILGF